MNVIPGKKFVKNHERKCLTKCARMWYNRKLRLSDAGDLLRKKKNVKLYILFYCFYSFYADRTNTQFRIKSFIQF